MKENREVTDTNVEDIEEALEKLSTGKKIKLYELLRTFKREGIENFVTTRKKYIDVILSDYKKLQEEFKQVDHECERLEEKEVRLIKENEKLRVKIDINISYAEYLEKILNEYKKESILKQKVKNMIKEKEWALENYDCDTSDYKQSQAIGAWNILQKLLKESEE